MSVQAATSPPEEGGSHGVRLKARAFDAMSSLMLPMMRRVARPYVGGDTIADALAIAQRLAEQGLPNTVGYWDVAKDTPRSVADVYIGAFASLASSRVDTYQSLKPPAVQYDASVAREIAAAAKESAVRVHCDSHAPEQADDSHRFEQALVVALGAENVSTTLPGRWQRSLTDADWVVETGIRARVVKGQWPDPSLPGVDLRAGYLAVVDRLAGKARDVGIATHDVELAGAAMDRLERAGTRFELELLYGLPLEAPLAFARAKKIPVRVYVPFGPGFVPSAVGVLRRNPRLALTMLQDVFFGGGRP